MRIEKVFLWMFFVALTSTALGQHKLTLNLTDMTPHVGQLFQVRVIDKASSEEVGRKTIGSIPSAAFQVNLFVILEGHDYRIDFYADFSGNGQYDPPPADHGWRLQLDNAVGDTTLNFQHNTNFTDIGWSTDSDVSEFAGEWNGYWMNLTYNTTDSIHAVIEVIPDSQKVRITSTTAGVFGNPQTVTFKGEFAYDNEADSIVVPAPNDWTGSTTASHGELHGSVTAPDYGGITLDLNGNFGPSQVIMTYDMSGAFTANGIIVLIKKIETSVEQVAAGNLPDQFVLYQNYPNPFNPITNIEYGLPQAGQVTWIIYSILGQKVRTLVDEKYPAGHFAVTWDGKDDYGNALSSGTYFYQVQVRNHGELVYRNTEKLLLLK